MIKPFHAPALARRAVPIGSLPPAVDESRDAGGAAGSGARAGRAATALCLALALSLGAGLVACAAAVELPAGETIGEPLEPREIVPLSVVLSQPERYYERTVLIRGRVSAVCKMRGCWMEIEDGAAAAPPVRALVRWEAGCGGQYAFPSGALGREVVLQGSIYAKELSADEREHLAEESGGEVKVPSLTHEINASSMRIVAAS